MPLLVWLVHPVDPGRSDMIADVGDTRLFYQTAGNGSPILLMHGGLGLDHTCFLPWLEPLADDRTQLIFYDHRGNGRSERPADWNAVTHLTWADDADALRAHLGHERVVALGHSYGGFLALEYASDILTGRRSDPVRDGAVVRSLPGRAGENRVASDP